MAPRLFVKEKPLFRPPSWGASPQARAGAKLRQDTTRVSGNPKCFKNLNLLTNGVLSTPFLFSVPEKSFMKEFVCVA
jgi:hypothetical protein